MRVFVAGCARRLGRRGGRRGRDRSSERRSLADRLRGRGGFLPAARPRPRRRGGARDRARRRHPRHRHVGRRGPRPRARMYRPDPASGAFSTLLIPVQHANPRAIDIDERGRWWVALGGPDASRATTPRSTSGATGPSARTRHSIRVDAAGRVWFNGHFTVEPEVIRSLDGETGEIRRYEVPYAPTADTPSGESTIPYGLRVAPDGTVWATQLRGGHLIRIDPATGDVRQFAMPSAHAGPRRPDVAPDGAVWIPLHSAGQLARFARVTATSWRRSTPSTKPSPPVRCLRAGRSSATSTSTRSAAKCGRPTAPHRESLRRSCGSRGGWARRADAPGTRVARTPRRGSNGRWRREVTDP